MKDGAVGRRICHGEQFSRFDSFVDEVDFVICCVVGVGVVSTAIRSPEIFVEDEVRLDGEGKASGGGVLEPLRGPSV